METVHTTWSDGEHLMDMPIALKGRDIVFGASVVRFYGIEQEIPEERITIEPRAEAMIVRALIVRDESGTMHLFVDEWIQDGVDMMWEPERDGAYHPMALLLQVEIPPGAMALDELPLHRWRIIPTPNLAPEEADA